MSDKDLLVLRASGLGDFLDCARRALGKALGAVSEEFGYRRSDGSHNVSSLMGTALHHYAENREGETAREWLDRARGDKPVIWDTRTPSEVVARRQLREMADEFERHLGEGWRENGVLEEGLENRFIVGGVPILLSGHPDKIDADGRVIRDLKTGRKTKFIHGAQLGGYIRLAEKQGLGGADGYVDTAVIHFVPRDGDGVTDEVYGREECVSQARNGMMVAARAWGDFRKRGRPDDVSANPRSGLCSKDYCGAHGTDWCPLSRGKLETAA